jgi:UrcA family protein
MGIYSIARRQAAPFVLVLAAFGFIAQNNPTMAQNATTDQNAPLRGSDTSAATEEVPVTAPARELVRRTVGRTRSAARVEEVTITHQVGYNDLDLKKAADVDELNRRVRTAAEESCAELDRLFPATKSRRATRECVNRAVGQATPRITAAVSGSGGRYGGQP